MLERLQKNWWLLALRGLLVLIFGLIALFMPGVAIASILLYLGVIALIAGIVILFEGFAAEKGEKGIKILEGIIYIMFGLLFLVKPGYILSFTLYFIAFWALLAGIFQIYSAIKLRKVIQNEWLLILNGIISIIFALLIFSNVVAATGAIIMVIGIYAIISGIMMIMASFRIKGLKKSDS